jgi:uncharacterized delta-60 repeat protein
LEARHPLALDAMMVRDINTGAAGSFPMELESVGETLYFTAITPGEGRELWKTDGTSLGTTLVKDIFVGQSSATPSQLTNINGTLYFRANDGISGFELWKSDGTAEGTVRVKDISLGATSSNPTSLTSYDGYFLFAADDGSTGSELWRSDGTEVGTRMVKDIQVGHGSSGPQYLTSINSLLYFSANDGMNGSELWKSDGTTAGTVLIKDIYPGPIGAVGDLAELNGIVYFRAYDGPGNGELWRTDGTEIGTKRVKDIWPGSEGGIPQVISNVNGVLYFSAVEPTTGQELWKSDGTEAGTVLVIDIEKGPSSSMYQYINVGGTLFFRARESAFGAELWKSDGTNVGTTRVSDINRLEADSYPQDLTEVEGKVFFRAYDTVHGEELWASDGTYNGTVLVKDIWLGATSSKLANLTYHKNTLFFSATDGSGGSELWRVKTENSSPMLNTSYQQRLGRLPEGMKDPVGVEISNVIEDGSITDQEGAVEAIAITALNTTLGTWQYRITSTAPWRTIHAELINSQTDELALLLGPASQIRLLPFGDLNGFIGDAITFRAWDQSKGADGEYYEIRENGGSSAFSSEADVISLFVDAVNDEPSFKLGNGIVTKPVGLANDLGRSIIAQPDGKILLAGTYHNGVKDDLSLMRFESNGEIDISFGVGGKVTTAVSDGFDRGWSVTLQPDGKIIVVGSAGTHPKDDFALVRYNSDGSLDTGFGIEGKVRTDLFAGSDSAESVIVQADGKIVVAGRAFVRNSNDFAIVRYLVDGTRDAGFGVNGIVTTDFGGGSDMAFGITLQADGKLIANGFSANGATETFALARYNHNGSLDTSFGQLGKVTSAVGEFNSYSWGSTLQNDGKILIAGRATKDGSQDFAIVRYNPDGTLDTQFGSNGKVVTPVSPGDDWGLRLTVQSDGKIVLGGNANHAGNADFALVRYNTDGTLDSGFGLNGIVTTDIDSKRTEGFSIALQPDGKVLLGGSVYNGTNYDFALARYTTDGSLDITLNQTSTIPQTVFLAEPIGYAILAPHASVSDIELSKSTFGNSSIVISRTGAASEDDHFFATGTLRILQESRDLVLDSEVIGKVEKNSNGILKLRFNSNAKNDSVNLTLRQIAYTNKSRNRPDSVQIEITFDDGNVTEQGGGGAAKAIEKVRVFIATNRPPQDITLSSTTVAENAGDYAKIGTLNTVDPDNGDEFTYSFLAEDSGNDNSAFYIIVPTEETSVKTPGNVEGWNIMPFGPVGQVRYQQLYSAALFGNIGPLVFTSIGFTPGSLGIYSASVSIRLNQSKTRIGDLSVNLEDNISGVLETVFYDSAFSARIPDENGASSLRFHFSDNSFVYNPSLGENLLVDILISGNRDGWLFAREGDNGKMSRAFNGYADRNGLSTSFEFQTLTEAKVPTLHIIANPDFETKSSYTIKIRSTDRGGLFFDKEFIIWVKDLPDAPFQNYKNIHDVDDDGFVGPLDVLRNIDFLNLYGGSVPVSEVPLGSLFFNVDGDFFVSPLDVLMLVNYINSLGNGSNGEGDPDPRNVANLEDAVRASNAWNPEFSSCFFVVDLCSASTMAIKSEKPDRHIVVGDDHVALDGFYSDISTLDPGGWVSMLAESPECRFASLLRRFDSAPSNILFRKGGSRYQFPF